MDAYTLIANLTKEIQIPEKGILSHTLHNDEKLKIILFGFAAGQELTAHTAPMPATMMFLKGEASVTLGNDTQEISEGALIHMQPKLAHGIVANSPLLMLLYLHKSARDQN
jgi:quercetin dioxygenase-like cupin family protein